MSAFHIELSCPDHGRRLVQLVRSTQEISSWTNCLNVEGAADLVTNRRRSIQHTTPNGDNRANSRAWWALITDGPHLMA